jgi:ABC-2 type transport system permease protein
VLALFIANLKMLARNRQAAFWALFFPLLLVVVFGLIDIKGVGSGSLAIVDQANNVQSELLRAKLAAVELLELEPDFDIEAQARLKVAEGDLDYLVIIPPGFGQSGILAEPPSPTGVRLLYQSRNGQRNQLVDGLIRSLVAETQDGDLPLPLSQLVVSEVIQVPEVDYFDQVLMGLIGLGIMTNSIISIAVRVSTYRNQAILKRLLVTPLPIWKYFAGEVTAHLVLAAVQVAIILLVGVVVFGAHIHGNVAWIFLIALLGSMVFLNIGFILSAWAQSPAAASGMGNAVALPMMFFAGTFFSTATLPWVLPHAAYALPLTPMLDALREVAIDSGQLWDTGPQLGILGLWVIGTALIASRVFRFS